MLGCRSRDDQRVRMRAAGLPLLLLAVVSGCAAHPITITGALAIERGPATPVVLDPRTPASITIPAKSGAPEVVVPDLPALLSPVFGHSTAETRVVLTIVSIDLDGREPGDEHLAFADGVVVQLAHGHGPELRGMRVNAPRYVRISFEAVLRRGDTAIAHVRGTVTGTKQLEHSDDVVRTAIASAVDKLLEVLDRTLIAPRTAFASSHVAEALASPPK